MAWTAPTVATTTVNVDASATPTVPAPTADDSAKNSVTAMSVCYENGNDCATTGTYASGSVKYADGSASGTTLPSWITWAHATQVLTVAPNAPNLAGTHSLLATYTPTNGSASIFTVMTITVECVVTSFTRPSNPSSGLTYNLWDSALSFDFS